MKVPDTQNTNAIIIVSGLPRSGTSLMMQMLHRGGIEPLTDDIRIADEDNPNGYYEFERVKKIRDDNTWLPTARGRAVKMISQLLYDLPSTESYKVLFMRRDLDEILVSQERMLIRRGVVPPDRNVIRAAFEKHLDRLFRWIPQQSCVEMLEIDYSSLIHEPALLINQLGDFLKHELDSERMLSAVDPKLYRNRKDKNW
jgi:hypothetical protein